MPTKDRWTSDRPDFLAPQRARVMSVEQFNASGFGRESALQVECVKWFRDTYPNLEMLLVSNLNGAELTDRRTQWPQLVAEGAVAGVADLTLRVPSGDYGCLEIEMKTRRGKQRPSQRRFQIASMEAGNAYVMPRSLRQFQDVVRGYLESGEIKTKP